VPVPDIYDLGETMMSMRGVSTLRIALVSSHESIYPDRFFETVVKNRGMGLQVFIDDFEAAVSWLRS
jgi:sensor c-di-GMP phosphodiesterase-like protein